MNGKTRVIHRPREADAQTAVGCQTGAPGRSSCVGQLILNKDLIKRKKKKHTHTHTNSQKISLGVFPGGVVVKSLSANSGDTEIQLQSLGWDDPLE